MPRPAFTYTVTLLAGAVLHPIQNGEPTTETVVLQGDTPATLAPIVSPVPYQTMTINGDQFAYVSSEQTE